eukprot:888434-Alexandrium_andersonii.AAC.1
MRALSHGPKPDFINNAGKYCRKARNLANDTFPPALLRPARVFAHPPVLMWARCVFDVFGEGPLFQLIRWPAKGRTAMKSCSN